MPNKLNNNRSILQFLFEFVFFICLKHRYRTIKRDIFVLHQQGGSFKKAFFKSLVTFVVITRFYEDISSRNNKEAVQLPTSLVSNIIFYIFLVFLSAKDAIIAIFLTIIIFTLIGIHL